MKSNKRKHDDVDNIVIDSINPNFRRNVKYLCKSEPYEYGIDDLAKNETKTGRWDGVHNYLARNTMRDMKMGDLIYFYHSNMKNQSGIYGIMEVIREAYPDPSSIDPSHKNFDPKCEQDPGKWVAIDVRLVEKWSEPILLSEMKGIIKEKKRMNERCVLEDMILFKISRLSVQLVKPEEAAFIADLLHQRNI